MVSANASSTLNAPMLITRHLPYIDIFYGVLHLSPIIFCVVATDDDASGTSMRCTMIDPGGLLLVVPTYMQFPFEFYGLTCKKVNN
jgi:hypothetical protein